MNRPDVALILADLRTLLDRIAAANQAQGAAIDAVIDATDKALTELGTR